MFYKNERASSRLIGSYELLEVIGEGGMANVYLGIKKSVSDIHSFYAIKRIKPTHSGSERFVKMFIDEAKVLATIQHPNLVILHDVLEQNDDYAIVMEYLKGVDGRQLLRQHQSGVHPSIATNIIAQACAGLHHAHQAKTIDGQMLNLIHRDISPHNLMVTFDGYVKVLDFGIAKSTLGLEETKTGIMKGKLHYFSPEQCNPDLGIDHRTDIFALGIVYYELLTGQRPFRGQNELQIIQSIMFAEVESPQTIRPEIPDEVTRIVLKALSHDPDQRFQSCDAFRSALIAVSHDFGWDLSERAMAHFMRVEHAHRQRHVESRLKEHIHSADVSSQELLVRVDETQTKTLHLGPDCVAKMITQRNHCGFVLSGQIKESMNMETLLEHASGRVVLHLEQVSKLTSFGIRHWLVHFPKLLDIADEVFATHVSVSIVNQMVMIPSMMDGLRILSIMAPYHCVSCEHRFTHEIAVGHDIDEILTVARACPKCGESQSIFDEDESYLNPLQTNLNMPKDIAAFVEKLKQTQLQAKRVPIEKMITEVGTELHIHEMAENTRWDRLLDGLDGTLRIHFGQGLAYDGAWLERFSKELEKLVHIDLSSMAQLPVQNEAALRQWRTQYPGLISVQLESSCTFCQATELRLWAIGERQARASCRSCSNRLTIELVEAVQLDDVVQLNPPPVLTDDPQTSAQNYIYAGVVILLILAIVLVIVL